MLRVVQEALHNVEKHARATRVRVELEHRGFERHGAGANGVRAGIDAPTGWTLVLELFAKHAAA